MTATDAQTHWMSAKIPNDQFLLFGFVGVRAPLERVAADLERRASAIADLRLRVREVPVALDHPYWVSAPVGADQVRIHRGVSDWDGCLADLAGRMADQLDTTSRAWRVHLYDAVQAVPGADGATTVAVLQIAHALGDGSRATRIARELFDSRPITTPENASPVRSFDIGSTAMAGLGLARLPLQLVSLVRRGRRAHLAHRDLERDIATGELAEPRPGGPRAPINAAPGERRELRVVLTSARRLHDLGGSVTVGALVVIGQALASHLSPRPDTDLRAEVTIAKPGPARARNHFRNAGVDLHVDETDPTRRATAIRDDLDAARRRTDHHLTEAESAAMRSVPAALLAWGVRSFDTAVVPELVTGHTVVSSVHRGAADLTLGGGQVCLTAGFPALSPVQSLTHGVHGIGDTVAISITASPDVVTDLDGYRDRVVEALG
ncbi:WS/DGAT domain-containing protein [Williamsia phyllosphaerae]|nr:WS/DGAT domain-containing protein [Williamsia phyllosphaerae]